MTSVSDHAAAAYCKSWTSARQSTMGIRPAQETRAEATSDSSFTTAGGMYLTAAGARKPGQWFPQRLRRARQHENMGWTSDFKPWPAVHHAHEAKQATNTIRRQRGNRPSTFHYPASCAQRFARDSTPVAMSTSAYAAQSHSHKGKEMIKNLKRHQLSVMPQSPVPNQGRIQGSE